MAAIITQEGRQWMADRLFGNTNGSIDTIVLGTDKTTPQLDDQNLGSEIYRAGFSQSNVEVASTINNGEYVIDVEVSAGTEVNPGVIIYEYGLISSADGVFIGRETLNGLEVNSGSTVSIAPPVDMFP